ncbi:MAG TPA: hypothetical protein VI485_18335 [Vicinamibacterales bacterium]|nr:hypothetical protein [Vicinamibacterales bacterium]
MRAAAIFLIAALAAQGVVSAQTRRAPARRAPAPAAKPLPVITEPAVFNCPVMLGQGASADVTYCDVQIGRDPAGGIIIPFPAHQGPVTLSFTLHNRHTYSEEQIKTNRSYHRYTATIGVLTMDNYLVSRAVVQNEFRAVTDLVDRIRGGSGPGGLKAVAPTGAEQIVVVVPEEEKSVSILGEKLSVLRVDSQTDTFTAPGRPIAVISNVMLEYRPAPPPRRTPARRK